MLCTTRIKGHQYRFYNHPTAQRHTDTRTHARAHTHTHTHARTHTIVLLPNRSPTDSYNRAKPLRIFGEIHVPQRDTLLNTNKIYSTIFHEI